MIQFLSGFSVPSAESDAACELCPTRQPIVPASQHQENSLRNTFARCDRLDVIAVSRISIGIYCVFALDRTDLLLKKYGDSDGGTSFRAKNT